MNSSLAGTPGSPVEHDSPNVNSKKRKVGTSGRGVATLTPEQLAKKRANDREAQRAIRERTKATIESLERKIQALESQQPYQELQAIIRQKDAVQAENDEIRRRLASILSIIQPVVGAQGLTDLATAAQHNVQMGFGQSNNNLFQQADQYLNNGQRQYQNHSPGLASPQGTSAYPAQFTAPEQETANDNRVWTTSRDALNQQRDNLQRNLELNESGERLTFNFLLGGLNKHSQVPNLNNQNGHDSTRPEGQYSTSIGSNPFTDTTQPVYTMMPKHCPPTCPLDNILLNFLSARQRDIATASNHYPPPAYPSVSSLLNPSSSHHSNIDPISQLMTDIIGKFPNISGLPEQVATLFFMFLLMRWQIYPTQDNYDRLPEWLTPRPSQLFNAHPAWVDHLLWPRMRDKVIANYADYPFENWFLPFTMGLSVNWPYEPVDCLLSTGPGADDNTGGTTTSDGGAAGGNGGGGETIINPVFERHIRRLENWSLGSQFSDAFPALADTATFKESKATLNGHGQEARSE